MENLYYNATIRTWSKGKAGVSMITGGDTIEKALSEMLRNAIYYKALGYKVEIGELRPFCVKCNSSGVVRKGVRVSKYVKCPACKGKYYPAITPAFTVEIPETVNLTLK